MAKLTPPHMEITGVDLADLRGQWGLTQAELAEALGISRPTLSAFEKRDTRLPRLHLLALQGLCLQADALGLGGRLPPALLAGAEQ